MCRCKKCGAIQEITIGTENHQSFLIKGNPNCNKCKGELYFMARLDSTKAHYYDGVIK